MRSGEYVKTEQGYELASSVSLPEAKHKKTCRCDVCKRERSKAQRGQVEEVK